MPAGVVARLRTQRGRTVTAWAAFCAICKAVYELGILVFGVSICVLAWRVRKLARRVDPYVEPGVELLRNASEAARLGLAWLRTQAVQAEDVRVTRAAAERIEGKVDEVLDLLRRRP